jgi:phosphonate transport system substrate-binding protein
MKFSIFILVTMFTLTTAQAKDYISFGIVPQQSSSTLAKAWIPLMQFLSEKTGKEIRFETAPDIPEFEARVAAGNYDIAYMNPYHYTVFSHTVGMVAISRQKDKLIRGIIVVNKNSPIKSIEMLDKATLAFPAPASFAATILPQTVMKLKNITFDSQYVSSHDSVYRSVAEGLFVAGGGIERTLSTVSPEIRNNLTVLWRSEGFTPHAVAVHPRVDQKTRLKIQNALLSLSEEEQGLKILKKLGFKGFINSEDTDWDDVRNLNIDQLDR